MIHRYLAARNIFLTQQNNIIVVKIGDHGLARKQKSYYMSQEKYLEADLPLPWMAPESLSINHRNFSVATDVWSIGIVLSEIFTFCEFPSEHDKLPLKNLIKEKFAQWSRGKRFTNRPSRIPQEM